MNTGRVLDTLWQALDGAVDAVQDDTGDFDTLDWIGGLKIGIGAATFPLDYMILSSIAAILILVLPSFLTLVVSPIDPREEALEGQELRRLAPIQLAIRYSQHVQGVPRSFPR